MKRIVAIGRSIHKPRWREIRVQVVSPRPEHADNPIFGSHVRDFNGRAFADLTISAALTHIQHRIDTEE